MRATARNAAASPRSRRPLWAQPARRRLADRQRIRLPRHGAVLFRRRRAAFRDWLRAALPTIDSAEPAWGNVFWSMEYASFDEIDLPNLTVTEPNPAHVLAFRRFSRTRWCASTARRPRSSAPRTDAPISHNYMGRVLDFDHFAVGADLDIATWDSYPLGFLEDRARRRCRAQRAIPAGRPGFPGLPPRPLPRRRARALVGDGAAARPGELGALQPRPAARHGAALDLGGLRPRRRGGELFPLAAGALRAGADACRPAAPRQRRRRDWPKRGRWRANWPMHRRCSQRRRRSR
jgi:hypothetical protein